MTANENIPEKILKAGTKLPFEVPESYFRDFPDRMMSRIKEEAVPVRQLHPLRSGLAVAAVLIGIISIGYAGFSLLSRGSGTDLFAEDEMNQTIEFIAWEIDNSMLTSAVLESDVLLDDQQSESSSDEIIRNLSEDDIDFSTLFSEH